MFVKKISSAELSSFLEEYGSDVALIDVREDNEIERGTIDGAHHYPLSRFTDKSLPPQSIYVFYCQSGHRSQIAAEHVLTLQLDKTVYNVTDGISGWLRAGLTIKPGHNEKA